MAQFIKPVNIRNQVYLDPEQLVNAFGSYEKGRFAERYLFDLDGLSFTLRIYPDGRLQETMENMCAILLCIEGDIMDDNRVVTLRINGTKIPSEDESDDSDVSDDDSSVSTFSHLTHHSVKAFIRARGWIIDHSKVRESDDITFKVDIVPCSAFSSDGRPKTTAFQSQLEKMNELIREHGDITLVVKIQSDDADILSAPPAKKQKIEDVEIKVSGAILRSASNVFDIMLKNEMTENKEKKIEVYAKSVDDVNAMIYFMCTNEVPNEANAHNLIHLAHFYQMDRLFSKCAQDIVQTVSVDNFGKTLSIFDKYTNKNGYRALVHFAKKNKKALKKSKDYDKIPHSFKCIALNEAE